MNYTDLMSAIKLMGQGMLAIFIVMAAISVIVYLFTKLSK
ncbi:MAG: sodium pump decarboxylase gamma subunit [Clostridia bacterium]|nr:sodium pump decarboxylase gamma subunit [Clostridia bacterium]